MDRGYDDNKMFLRLDEKMQDYVIRLTSVVLSFDTRYVGLLPMASFCPCAFSISSALGWHSLALYGNSRDTGLEVRVKKGYNQIQQTDLISIQANGRTVTGQMAALSRSA